MRGQRQAVSRPGSTIQNRADPVYLRDTLDAADDPGDPGEYGLPLVFGLRDDRACAALFDVREELHTPVRGFGHIRANLREDINRGCGGGLRGRQRGVHRGLFHKGEHKKEFAYTAHVACDKHNFVLGAQVSAGNVHDSVMFDGLYKSLLERFPEVKMLGIDSSYTPLDP